MKRLTKLTDAQKALMPEWTRQWTERGLQTGKLTEDEWAQWETAAKACYTYANVDWPGVVIRVPNPLVGTLAAPIANHVITDLRAKKLLPQKAVGSAVDSAVDSAVRSAVANSWYYRIGGQWWAYWHAYILYFKEIGLELTDDIWDRAQAYAATATAGWWWPYRDFVMVSDRPTELHLEKLGVTDAGIPHRLHNDKGPAIAWDGWGLHYWHGTQVPADLIEQGWDAARIITERNTEIRRCAIERLGWDTFIQQAKLKLVATAPDPGNTPHTLDLYDLPRELADTYEQPARILLCVNGTPERDGTRHRFGLPVPAHHTDPVEAAADLYGWPVAAYRQLEVRR